MFRIRDPLVGIRINFFQGRIRIVENPDPQKNPDPYGPGTEALLAALILSATKLPDSSTHLCQRLHVLFIPELLDLVEGDQLQRSKVQLVKAALL